VLGLLKNIRILSKISIPAVVIAVVATAIVAYSTHSLGTLGETTDSVVAREAKRVEFALEAEALFNSAAVSEKNVILFQEEEPMRLRRTDPLHRLDAVENKHLHIHRHDVELGGFYGLDRLHAVLGDLDIVTGLLQQYRCQLLVDLVVVKGCM